MASFFDDVFDLVFGGTDVSAQEAQQRANELARQSITSGTERAEATARQLFPAGQQARTQGLQAALDVLGQSIPGQVGALQQGFGGAQGTILAGLPQIQAAILGQPIDLSTIQPTTINAPTGFAQQTVPFDLSQANISPFLGGVPKGFGLQPGGDQAIHSQPFNRQASFANLLGGGGFPGSFAEFSAQPGAPSGTGLPGLPDLDFESIATIASFFPGPLGAIAKAGLAGKAAMDFFGGDRGDTGAGEFGDFSGVEGVEPDFAGFA